MTPSCDPSPFEAENTLMTSPATRRDMACLSKTSLPFWYSEIGKGPGGQSFLDTYMPPLRILHLPAGFLQALRQNQGIFLSPSTGRISSLSDSEDDFDEGASDGAESSSDENESRPKKSLAETFPEFAAQVNEAIKELGGKTFVKLNWSCVNDAAWIMPGQEGSCSHFDEVALQLQASDRVHADLDLLLAEEADALSCEPALILKKWQPVVGEKPSTHEDGHAWRLFIHGGLLKAISQRYLYYWEPWIASHADSLSQTLTRWWNGAQPHFFRIGLSTFAVDVYLRNERVTLLDVNTLDAWTDTALFALDEIFQMSPIGITLPQFRFIQSATDVDGKDIGGGPFSPLLTTQPVPLDLRQEQ